MKTQNLITYFQLPTEAHNIKKDGRLQRAASITQKLNNKI